jgi:bifunctional DNase/RNase
VVVVRLASISLDPRDGRAVAVFVDNAGRCLPLWVDDDAAAALADGNGAARVLVDAVKVCGGAIDRCELTHVDGGVLRALVVVLGTDVTPLAARASFAAAVARVAGVPLLVDDAVLAHAHARLNEATARAASLSTPPADAPLTQTAADRWNALLDHLAERLHDDRPS